MSDLYEEAGRAIGGEIATLRAQLTTEREKVKRMEKALTDLAEGIFDPAVKRLARRALTPEKDET